tara:strand:- start:29 stop:952 length:924 start_codon:yes stop_codon:yes gene_type:complete
MLDKGIIMEDVYLAIMNYNPNSINFIYCDENSKQLIGRISIISDIKGEIDEINGLEDQNDIITTFKNIKKDLLENVIIKGVENITNIVMSEISGFEDEKKNKNVIHKGKIKNELIPIKKWILETDGTNLLSILSKDYIDSVNTSSNDVIETYELLGIEATRNLLIEQLNEVFDSYINNHHIELLCDLMTSTGKLISINRQGINRGDNGPLSKCSFENTTEELINAGIFGKIDKLEGVSSNIMLGQKIHAGTNNCEILLDEEKLIELLQDEEEEDIHEIEEQNIDILFSKIEEDEEGCEDEDFKFSYE